MKFHDRLLSFDRGCDNLVVGSPLGPAAAAALAGDWRKTNTGIDVNGRCARLYWIGVGAAGRCRGTTLQAAACLGVIGNTHDGGRQHRCEADETLRMRPHDRLLSLD